jgi:hypothetical protein
MHQGIQRISKPGIITNLVPTRDGTCQLENKLTSLVLTDLKSMSIELFAGKSNIFESNRRPGKIQREIPLTYALPEVRLG